jgi:hypothetical protein
MGSQYNPQGGKSNEIRLLDPSGSEQSCAMMAETTAIARLVEHLRFDNPEKAKAFLHANPGILGQVALLPKLSDQVS